MTLPWYFKLLWLSNDTILIKTASLLWINQELLANNSVWFDLNDIPKFSARSPFMNRRFSRTKSLNLVVQSLIRFQRVLGRFNSLYHSQTSLYDSVWWPKYFLKRKQNFFLNNIIHGKNSEIHKNNWIFQGTDIRRMLYTT